MNLMYNLRFTHILLALVVALGSALPGLADEDVAASPAELLEEAIYAEQTVGDLDGAIEIYRRILARDGVPARHGAQAQFRLGMGLRALGETAEAEAAFEALLRDFPEQTTWADQAREQLEVSKATLRPGPAPWQDGELLIYRISVPASGLPVGKLFHRVGTAVVDGVDVWKMETRRLGFGGADQEGVSRVFVDRSTQLPIRSAFLHKALGRTRTTYGPDGATIIGAAGETTVTSDRTIYDNEQVMYLLRSLPLAPGFEATLQVLPSWAGAATEVEVSVKKKAVDCKTPAGDSECLVVVIDLGKMGGTNNKQTAWVSTGPERQVAKVKAEGMVLDLAAVFQVPFEIPIQYRLDDYGIAGTLPLDWLYHEHQKRSRGTAIQFLDPDSEGIGTLEVDRCPRGRCPELQETAERELKGSTRRFEDFTLRDGSWTERTIDGRPAVSFVGDFQYKGESWVQYRSYTLTDSLRLEWILRAPADRFDALRPGFDAVMEQIRVE
ncbi:MAG: tetratricopeptide repeat protein [Acidobacteriota bacterium]